MAEERLVNIIQNANDHSVTWKETKRRTKRHLMSILHCSWMRAFLHFQWNKLPLYNAS